MSYSHSIIDFEASRGYTIHMTNWHYPVYRDIRIPTVAILVFAAGALASAESALDQLKNTPGARSGGVPDVPSPTCAGCNGRNGNHGEGCRYGPQAQKQTGTAHGASPHALSPSQQMAVSLAGGLFQGFLSSVFDDSGSQAAAEAAAAAAAAEKARYEAQARAAMEAAERQRRTALVASQRQKRDAEDGASLESLRAAMSGGFDTGTQDPLAAALNDPNVVDLRGKQGVVQPGAAPAPPPVPQAAIDKAARDAAARRTRYEKMVEENTDAKVLAQRLAELEEKQGAVREQLVDLKRSANASVRVYEAAEQDVREATDAAMERGLGLAVDALLAGKGKALEHLKTVKSDSALWKETLRSVEGVDKVAEQINQTGEDVDWLRSKRDLGKDLEYLGDRVGILGPHWAFGKSIVESGMDIRKELQAMRSIREQDGLNVAYKAKLEDLSAQNRKLVEQLRGTREDLAKKLGVPVDQIPKPDYDPKAPTRLGIPVPHPND
jgi:hypothetical protein